MPPCEDPAGHRWQETETACELCGQHRALYCPECGELLDSAWDGKAFDEAAATVTP